MEASAAGSDVRRCLRAGFDARTGTAAGRALEFGQLVSSRSQPVERAVGSAAGVTRFSLPAIGCPWLGRQPGQPAGDGKRHLPERRTSRLGSCAGRRRAATSVISAALLIGLCAGAYYAFQAAAQFREPGLAESLLINPLAFDWAGQRDTVRRGRFGRLDGTRNWRAKWTAGRLWKSSAAVATWVMPAQHA